MIWLYIFIKDLYLGETLGTIAAFLIMTGFIFAFQFEIYKEKYWLQTATYIFLLTGIGLKVFDWLS